MKRFRYGAAQLAFVVALIAVWQWASSTGRIDAFFFGTPSEIWHLLRSWASDGSLAEDVRSTVVLLGVGYLVGLAIGIALGCLIGLWRPARDVLEPYLIFLNAVPRIILYPFLVVWLGFGLAPKVVSIVLVMVTAVTINIAVGFKEVQGEYLSNMRAMGASRLDLALHVYVPSLALWVLSTCRITFGFAFQAAIAAELIASTAGLGFRIVDGQSKLNVNMIYAALAVIVVLAVVMDAVLSQIERRATRWMPRRA
jgi:NitT/TauT family transport system permease protein